MYLIRTLFLPYPSHFVQFSKHDNDRRVVFPKHAPEIVSGDLQRALSGNICTSLPVAVYEVCVDVVRTF